MNDPHAPASGETKKAAVNGFAIVGFAGLLVLGIVLAVYAARYVPETLERLAGAVYLSPSEEPVDETPETPAVVTPEEEEEPATPSTPWQPTPTTPTTGTPIYYRQVPVTVPMTGRPNLEVDVLAVGYLRTSSATSFREDNEVPDGERPAIRFRVTNTGTNQSGFYDIEVEYPAEGSRDTYTIRVRESLMPKGTKDFTFGFDDPETGSNKRFTVTVDPDDDVDETSERDNDDSATIDIER